jgi:hypothetical protein
MIVRHLYRHIRGLLDSEPNMLIQGLDYQIHEEVWHFLLIEMILLRESFKDHLILQHILGAVDFEQSMLILEHEWAIMHFE